MIRALTSLALSAAVVLPVMAHEAPTGWRYGWECCSNQDCRQLAGSEVSQTHTASTREPSATSSGGRVGRMFSNQIRALAAKLEAIKGAKKEASTIR